MPYDKRVKSLPIDAYARAGAATPKPETKRKAPADKKNRVSERIAVLGIPEKEMTQSVSLAVSALLEKLDDVNNELLRTKETLAEIERLVDVDCIAPIPNRRAFMRRLSWAIAMHDRYEHPSSILYFDLNHFKEINDTYGHAAGDMAIKHFSQLLLDTMRESDFIARIGGDEFAIIMYYASDEAAKERGLKIAEKLRLTPFLFNGKPIHVQTAYGVYSLKKGDDPESALSAADMSMYVDKKRNRDQATNIEA